MRSTALILTVVFLGHIGRAQDEAPYPQPPSDVSSTAVVAGDDEPGTRLVITGRVFRADRKTPASGQLLFIYQTDITGVYNRTDNYYGRPRLKGWLKTDSLGNYTIRTIRPGSYPRRKEAAHIHATTQLPGSSPEWLESFLFSDDPNLTKADLENARTAGSFSYVLTTRKDKDGTLIARRDLVLKY